MALRVVDEDLDRVEAHRLGVDQPDEELGRVEQLQERRLVGGPGERRGVALGEAEARRTRRPGGRAPRRPPRSSRAGACSRRGTGRGASPSRGSSATCPSPAGTRRESAGREPGDLDRDPHHLLLVEDHAHRVAEDRLEARVEVGHRLEALLPAEVRVDGVALDRARPDDRDLDDEIVEAASAATSAASASGPGSRPGRPRRCRPPGASRRPPGSPPAGGRGRCRRRSRAR